jgi:hypothetical protein
MSSSRLPTGPDPEAITQVILERYPETVIAEALGATFFSLDDKHWPNYATIVTSDDHDDGAIGSRSPWRVPAEHRGRPGDI